jgi:sulfotransferase family protein
MSAAVGPDFLCIGMPKAGTQWLFDQLQYHPDFWMPPIKEIYYLDRPTPRLKNARRLLRKFRKEPERAERRMNNRRRYDARDMHFLEEAVRIGGEPRSVERYAGLFALKGDAKTGDITPNYCALPDEVVREIADTLPAIRVILLVRDPVARLWSHICMWHRQERFDEMLLEDAAKFRAFLEGEEHLLAISYPTKTAASWAQNAPKVAFRHFFLDDIATRPDEARRDVLLFLGADPAKTSTRFDAGFNRKSETAKLELTEDIKAVLVERMTGELRACAATFGGPAARWPALYGV